MSQNDIRFMKMMKRGITKEDGHYVLPLPLKHLEISFPNNRVQAERRCQSVKRKMSSNSQYHLDYTTFMEKLVTNGYAEKAEQTSTGNVWYIPHHAVYHPSKGTMRVVFDCAELRSATCC